MQGVAPGSATISTAAAGSALKLAITVSSEPACLVQLHTSATTGVAARLSTGDSLKPRAAGSLGWQARQDLVWEDSSALVLSYARFSDGSVMDVTAKTDVVAVSPGGAGAALPFTIDTDNTTGLHWLNVKVAVSIWTEICLPDVQSARGLSYPRKHVL